MITNILLTTDFSAASQATLPLARVLAKLFSATIHILHVADATPAQGYIIPDLNPDEDDDTVLNRVKVFVGLESLQDIPHTFCVRRGVVCDEVLEVVHELNIDLIVLGAHRSSELKRMLLGSVTEHILRKAPCPVMTVGPQATDSNLARGELATILCLPDFWQTSTPTFRYAANLARVTNAKVTLVHALEADNADKAEQEHADAQRGFSAFVEQNPSINCELVVTPGPASSAILNQPADLIVIHCDVTSGHNPWPSAHRVIKAARCPVLTLRDDL